MAGVRGRRPISMVLVLGLSLALGACAADEIGVRATLADYGLHGVGVTLAPAFGRPCQFGEPFRHRVRSASARASLLGLAMALGLFGLLWQGAAADGAFKMQARIHALSLQAERKRGDLAEADARASAEQATRDLAEAQADNAKLKDLLDALSRDPRGAHPAVPRDIARGLRNL